MAVFLITGWMLVSAAFGAGVAAQNGYPPMAGAFAGVAAGTAIGWLLYRLLLWIAGE
jgi:high-affinity Fe2+/Pb2+ permease